MTINIAQHQLLLQVACSATTSFSHSKALPAYFSHLSPDPEVASPVIAEFEEICQACLAPWFSLSSAYHLGHVQTSGVLWYVVL